MKMYETLSMLRKWWRTWNTFPVLSWVYAAALYRKGRYAEAEALYLRGVERHPNHPAHLCARLDLAYCQFKLGKLEEAERHLRFVVASSPNSREAHLRLARLQMWTGHALEAAWTMRRALQKIEADAELAATFLLSTLDAEAPQYLVHEASEVALRFLDQKHEKLELALARYEMLAHYERGRERIAEMACSERPLFDAIVIFSDLLVKEGKIAHARRQLRRAMSAAAEHPRVLSILAASYLKSGPFYNPDYALQHALRACQATNWMSPREMHVLAEAYYHQGDKMSALLVASRAKQAGTRLLGAYPEAKDLDRLIESLQTGTLA